MATKHLYVSGDDLTLWEEAEIIALKEHRSVSWVVHEALRRYVRAWAIEADKQARRATS